MSVNKIEVLSHNVYDNFSSTKVTASGVQCGSLGTSARGTWQQFECPPVTTADQIKVERDYELVFCGIKVWAPECGEWCDYIAT